MALRRIAYRYALALIETAGSEDALDALGADIRALGAALGGSRELRLFLRSPVVNKEKKKAVMRALFGASLGATTLQFLDLLCEKRRENVLAEIIEEFGALSDLRKGIVRPRVTSAGTLSAAQRDAIESRLAAQLNKRIAPVYGTNGALRGGLVVRLGDTVVDGSVAHQLELLRERLQGTPR